MEISRYGPKRVSFFFLHATDPGPNVLIAAPGAGLKIRVLALSVSSPDSVAEGSMGEPGFDPDVADGKWKWGRIGAARVLPLSQGFNPGGWFECAENTALHANRAIRGHIIYEIAPV